MASRSIDTSHCIKEEDHRSLSTRPLEVVRLVCKITLLLQFMNHTASSLAQDRQDRELSLL